MEIDDAIVRIAKELAKIPAALKTWRGPVTELLNEVMAAEHPIAAAVMWVGEKDLLKEVPVFFATNLKGDGIAKIIDHAYRRLVKTGRIKAPTGDASIRE